MSARYDAIDIHTAAKTVTWPAVIPPMSEADAVNAARRLFRWALGQTYTGDVVVTSGNRQALRLERVGRGRLIHVNPSKGWREFAHDASHWFDIAANGSSTHSKHHARFEAKLIREIVRRGWLVERAPVVVETKPAVDPRTVKLARIEAGILRWQAKAKRAENALKKLAKQRRYYEKAIATPAKPRAPRPKVESVKAKAARLGIEIEKVSSGYNVWPPQAIADDESDPYEGDHDAPDWSAVRTMVNAYAAILEAA